MTDLDPLLREAMAAMRGPVGARPSMGDVRRRARRHNRRRMTATVGVVACTGVATAALIVRRDSASTSVAGQTESTVPSATTISGVFLGATSTYPFTTTTAEFAHVTVDASMVWNALANLPNDPTATGLASPPADVDRGQMPTAAMFGCETDACAAMFNYVVWHELSRALGFFDIQPMKGYNPGIDFSQLPREGEVLQMPGFAAPPETTVVGEMTTPSTIACDQTAAAATVVVVNASHENGLATTWRGLLAATVPNASFADAVNAVAPEPWSRVLALPGFECPASQIASFIGGGIEAATAESLQSLMTSPLPAGTSIVVLVGDDKMEPAAGGSTAPATSTTVAPTTSNP
jgi:hypothetical protein